MTLPVCIHITFWISLSMRPKTETKLLNFGLSPELRLTSRHSVNSLTSSLMLSATHHWFHCISLFIFELVKKVIFTHQNLISNQLTYLVHAKSTGELISFGFSDCSVRSLVWANCWTIRWVQMKNGFTFWLIFGLGLNLGLNERLVQKAKWPNDC